MSAAEVANPRWWEGYLVRYMVGTPVGAFCVAAICHATFSSAKPYSQYLDTLHGKFASASLVVDATVAVAIAVISLAYCYIASSPITTFHATRMYRRSWFNRTSRYIWLGVWLLLLISVLFNFADTFILGVLAGPAVWTIFVQLLCVMRLHADDPANPNEKPIFIYGFLCNVLTGKKWEQSPVNFVSFYKDLVKVRAEDSSLQMRESYTHLREHSNAVFIVLLEISLAALIVCIINRYGGTTGHNVNLIVATLFVWCLPTVFLWTQANRLERSLINK